MSKNILFFLFLLNTTIAFSQPSCIEILNCTANEQTFYDPTINNPLLWNAPYWSTPFYPGNNLGEYEMDLHLTARSKCGNPLTIRYELYLDLDSDGDQETVVNSDNLPTKGKILFNNIYSTGNERIFDSQPGPDNKKFGFIKQDSIYPDRIVCRVGWNQLSTPNNVSFPQLPYGRHRIKWVVSDNQGNETTCSYFFKIEKYDHPFSLCKEDLVFFMPNSQKLVIKIADILPKLNEQAAAFSAYKFSMSRSYDPSNFPLDSLGNPITSLEYDCLDRLGAWIYLWMKDAEGKTQYCLNFATLFNVDTLCSQSGHESLLVGVTNWCDNQPLPNVLVTTQGPLIVSSMLAIIEKKYPVDGFTTFYNLPIGNAGYAVFPTDNSNLLNGVDVSDLILISQHIENLDTLSPIAQIAADINKDKVITNTDLDILQSVISGASSIFPNNTSRRFFNENQKEYILNNPLTNLDFQFERVEITKKDSTFYVGILGVKVGDVNCTSDPAAKYESPENNPFAQTIAIKDQYMQAGDQFKIPLYLGKSSKWLGFQFGLSFAPDLLKIQQVSPQSLPNFKENTFALSEDLLNCVWYSPKATAITEGEPFTVLTVKALQNGWLHDAIQLNESNPNLQSLGYNQKVEKIRLKLEFLKSDQVAPVKQHFIVNPNPTHGATSISFQLNHPASGKLSILDNHGNTVWTKQSAFDAGTQNIEIPAEAFPKVGMYFWHLPIGEQIFQGKIIRW